jgi:hypothetical protein
MSGAEQPRDDHGRFASDGSDGAAAGIVAASKQGAALRAERDAHLAAADAHQKAAEGHLKAGNTKKAEKHAAHSLNFKEAAERVNGVLERLRERVQEGGEKALAASDALIEGDPVKLGAAAMKVAMSKAAGGKGKKEKREDLVEAHDKLQRRIGGVE